MSIPNTLTIFINTNIRGNSKIIYKPYMTIPVEDEEKKKKEDVNFNPLIKLYKRVINDIPSGVDPKEIYTQFFKKNEFESLISRTISKTFQFRNTNLYTATKYGYIDNNIKLTLDTIFRHNAPFFIKDKAYLVDSYSWTWGDWRIDTKKIEDKFLSYNYPYMNTMSNYYFNNIGQEVAERELEMIPPQLRGGIMSQNQLSRFEQEFMGLKPADLQQQQMEEVKDSQKQNQAVKPTEEVRQTVYNNPILRSDLPAIFQNTFRQITDEPAVSLDENTMHLHFQPLTLNIIFNNDRTYMDLRKKYRVINKSYEDMMKTVEEYTKLRDEFDLKFGLIQDFENKNDSNILKEKKLSHELNRNLYDYFLNIKSEGNIFFDKNKENEFFQKLISDENIRNGLLRITREIIELNKKISKNLISLIEVLYKIFLKEYEVQTKYLNFYTELRNVYMKNLKKKPIPYNVDITLLLMDYDIGNYKNIVENISYKNYLKNFKYLVSYFKESLEPIINRNYNYNVELKRYYDEPYLLYLEKHFLSIYSYTISSNKRYHDMINWNSMNEYYKLFYANSLDIIKGQILQLNNDYKNYINNYTDTERESIQKSVELEREEGKKSGDNNVLNMLRSSSKLETGMEYYKKMETNIVLSYDLIYLFTYLSLIKIGKNNSYEKTINDVIKINTDITYELSQYYKYYKNVLTDQPLFLENYPYSIIAKNNVVPLTVSNLDNKINECKDEIVVLKDLTEKFKKRNETVLKTGIEEFENKLFSDKETYPGLDSSNMKSQCLSLLNVNKDEYGNNITLPNEIGNTDINIVVPENTLIYKTPNFNMGISFLPQKLKIIKPGSLQLPSDISNGNLSVNPLLFQSQPQSKQIIQNNVKVPVQKNVKPIVKPIVKPNMNIPQTSINPLWINGPQSLAGVQGPQSQQSSVAPIGVQGPQSQQSSVAPEIDDNKLPVWSNIENIPPKSSNVQPVSEDTQSKIPLWLQDKEEAVPHTEEIPQEPQPIKYVSQQIKHGPQLTGTNFLQGPETVNPLNQKIKPVVNSTPQTTPPMQKDMKPFTNIQKNQKRDIINRDKLKLLHNQAAQQKLLQEQKQKQEQEQATQAKLLQEQKQEQDTQQKLLQEQKQEQDTQQKLLQEEKITPPIIEKPLLQQIDVNKNIPEISSKYAKSIATPIIEKQTKETKQTSKNIREMFFYLSKTGSELDIIPELNNNETEYISQYTVVENESGGDCFFSALRDAFNGDNIYNNQNINVPPIRSRESIYAGPDGLFTVSGLRNAVAENFTEDAYEIYKSSVLYNPEDRNKFAFLYNPDGTMKTLEEVRNQIRKSCVASNNPNGGPSGNYWGDEYTIKIIEEVFKIKLIIFDGIPNNFSRNFFVDYKDKFDETKISQEREEKVGLIDKTDMYYDGSNMVKFPSKILNLKTLEDINISSDDFALDLYETQMSNVFYPVMCNSGDTNNSDVKDYVFMFLTELPSGEPGKRGSQHYQLVINTNYKPEKSKYKLFKQTDYDADFIFRPLNMNSYVLYWIYLTCCKNTQRTNFSTLPVIGQKIDNIKKNFKDVKKLVKMNGGGDDDDDEDDGMFVLNKSILQEGGQFVPKRVPPFNPNFNPNFGFNQYSPNDLQQPYQFIQPRIRSYGAKYADTTSPNTKEQSKLSYYVIVDLNVIEKGNWDKIPLDAQIKLRCNSTKEKMRKAYADMFGFRYEPIERRITSFFDDNTDTDDKKEKEDKKEDKKDEKKKGGSKLKLKNLKKGTTMKLRKH